MNTPIKRIAFVGFGEVGGIFGQNLAAAGIDVTVYDSLVHEPRSRESLIAKAKSANVNLKDSVEQAIHGAYLIFCATTASSALSVAKDTIPLLAAGQVYVDLNSVSPDTKISIANEFITSPADFVEGAVMAPVRDTRFKTPILLGGPRSKAIADTLNGIGMETSSVSEKIGVAAAIKMCRSVVVKGLAALAIEALFAARYYGAEEAVLASLETTYPTMGWATGLPDLIVMRAMAHSRRRAAEMRESAETIRESSVVPRMALAVAELQDWLTKEMEARHFQFQHGEQPSWQEVADAMILRSNVCPGNADRHGLLPLNAA
jgi:3-hydroxyisobutyrate dehydrogenase-like beta-hydroxyacid dehydrogenase